MPRTEVDGPEQYLFDFSKPDLDLQTFGFSGCEPIGRWTDGKYAELTVTIPASWMAVPALLFKFYTRGFVENDRLPEQRVTVSVNGVPTTAWSVGENYLRTRVLAVRQAVFTEDRKIKIGLEMHDCAQPSALGGGR